jgi:hypothetical protein
MRSKRPKSRRTGDTPGFVLPGSTPMEHLTTWLGAGVVTAGVSAALLAGAGVASADTDSGSDGGGANSSSSADKADKSDKAEKKESPSAKEPAKKSAADEPAKDDAKDADTSEKPDKTDTDKVDEKADDTAADDATEPEDTTEPAADEPGDKPAKKKTAQPAAESKPESDTATTPAAETPATAPEPVAKAEPVEAQPETAPVMHADTATIVAAAAIEAPEPETAKTSLASTRAALASAVAPAAPSLLGFVGSVIGAVVVNVGSIALTALQAVEALAAGPPVLPPGSTVTVRDSWITLGNGQRIAANWYYPAGDTPPDRMILLQHGFLALGPMYSYTAANLAEQTNSIVVTPSIPSNLFLGDDHWLGGTGMASQIADLFVGDRAALTQSALDAGFATRYGLDPTEAALPQKFALMGHSLGGNLVPAAAGFLARNGGAENLVGVITLDGVPFGGTVETALDRLADYEAATGHYVPIREIGAPPNLFNSISAINQSLSAARPDHFNGVVLTDGVHMDSMQGGNPVIQFAAYLVAGFPTPQNPPAVAQLSVQWLDEWFGGNPFIGDGLVPGSTFDIATPAGTAEATVIGDPPALRSLNAPLPAGAPTDIPSPTALLTTLAV